ncbi:MAG: F0F1 ATP synthase subunit epsilon [Syntrophomonadaceae bacterium]|nr:F0F1 ATP synthase subunit epsilon [Syntrophomonadaceae bacterium]
MADNTFALEVITPEKILFRDEAQFAVVPEITGELGVLKNHAPVLAALKTGVLRYTDTGGTVHKMAVNGGFMEVVYNEVKVLTETAERAEDIDVARAMAARDRAMQRLQARDDGVNVTRAEAALQRSISRLKAAGKYQQ